MSFKALLATRTDKVTSTRIVDIDEADLMPGEVTIAVEYSTVNYKDALAVSGRAEIIRQFPLIPGIDLAGTVEASTSADFAVGDRVVVNGWGLSQTHHGGFAQKARVKAEWVIKIPQAFSTKEAMAIGNCVRPTPDTSTRNCANAGDKPAASRLLTVRRLNDGVMLMDEF